VEHGTICYNTMVGGLGHEQGTRPVLVIGRTDIGARTGETIVLPISHVEPMWSYPFSWPVPANLLPRPSWVLINRPRAASLSRLRDPVAMLDRGQMDEITSGLQRLIEAS
jgi:mRNA-degrading endonuclease toxin of MazEF toxin-antitoxin module